MVTLWKNGFKILHFIMLSKMSKIFSISATVTEVCILYVSIITISFIISISLEKFFQKILNFSLAVSVNH